MPFCGVGHRREDSVTAGDEVKIFYQTYGRGRTKVLLIIGLAGTHDSWGPQIVGLTGSDAPNAGRSAAAGDSVEEGVEVFAFDNRGMGRSPVPTKKSRRNQSAGAMIACKLAAMVPHRISSLALLNVTGGGFECLPKQYVTAISATGMQSSHGFEVQVNACWNHKLTSKEIELMHSAGFHVSAIHGRCDVIAQQLYYARKLLEKLYPSSKMVELHGGHLVIHERPREVNQPLIELIAASESDIDLERWTNLFMDAGDKANETSAPCSRSSELANRFIKYAFDMIMWGIFCFFGFIMMFMSQINRVMKSLAPVRVDASRS